MERNSFKEYSVLAMVSKEEQRPIPLVKIFFHLDRVIAWLDEVATVTQADVWVKKNHRIITSELNLEWENLNSNLSLRDLDEKITSAR